MIRVENGACTKWTIPGGKPIYDVWAASATAAWVTVSQDGIWRFDGSTWTRHVALTGNDDVFLVGQQRNGGVYMPAIQHWNGATWESMTVPATAGPLQSIVGNSATDVYVVSQSGFLAHYNGIAWSMVDGIGQVVDVWGTANDLFAATYTGVQHFDGTQWTPVASGSTIGVRRITGIGPTIMMADAFGDWHEIIRLVPW